MKTALAILLALATMQAQVPSAPAGLSVSIASDTPLPVGSIIPVPVVSTNGQFIAYWYPPPFVQRTNISVWIQPIATTWLPEVSTDGVNWGRRSEGIHLPPRAIRSLGQPCLTCLHFTEVNGKEQVRIRLVAY